MRRAAATFFTVVAALSLLVTVAIVALVVRSHWVEDVFSWRRIDSGRLAEASDSFALHKGYLVVSSYREEYHHLRRFADVRRWNPHITTGWSHMSLPVNGGSWGRFGERPGEWELLGVGHQAQSNGDESSQTWRRLIVLPPWLLLVPGLVFPPLWLLRWRRRRFKRPPGLCPRCGYDLRATPGRCPECGTAAAVPK